MKIETYIHVSRATRIPTEDCPKCGFPNGFMVHIDGSCTTELQCYWHCHKCGYLSTSVPDSVRQQSFEFELISKST